MDLAARYSSLICESVKGYLSSSIWGCLMGNTKWAPICFGVAEFGDTSTLKSKMSFNSARAIFRHRSPQDDGSKSWLNSSGPRDQPTFEPHPPFVVPTIFRCGKASGNPRLQTERQPKWSVARMIKRQKYLSPNEDLGHLSGLVALVGTLASPPHGLPTPTVDQ